jgi:hypothetical protein
LLYAWASVDHSPPVSASLHSYAVGMTGVYHHAQPLVEMGSCELFAWLALNCDPPDLHLPSTWDFRFELSCLAWAIWFLKWLFLIHQLNIAFLNSLYKAACLA